jgi:hypothetical protein
VASGKHGKRTAVIDNELGEIDIVLLLPLPLLLLLLLLLQASTASALR